MSAPPALADRIAAGDPRAIARGISLVEAGGEAGADLVRAIYHRTGRAHLIGVTGPPGAGKSTLVDRLVTAMRAEGRQIGVIAVDPTSPFTGGALLGDRIRMESVALDRGVYIRSMASRGSLGGLATTTREVCDLLDAAGFDRILVETVGVGQSETAVAGMVDVFVVLLLPGGGDELQGIKKGILELADVVAVTKADGERVGLAREALRDVSAAGRLAGRALCAVLVSAREEAGLEELWTAVADRHAALARSGELEERRAGGRERWMWALVEEGLMEALRSSPGVGVLLGDTLREVRAGTLAPEEGARKLMEELVGQGWLVRGEIPRT